MATLRPCAAQNARNSELRLKEQREWGTTLWKQGDPLTTASVGEEEVQKEQEARHPADDERSVGLSAAGAAMQKLLTIELEVMPRGDGSFEARTRRAGAMPTSTRSSPWHTLPAPLASGR